MPHKTGLNPSAIITDRPKAFVVVSFVLCSMLFNYICISFNTCVSKLFSLVGATELPSVWERSTNSSFRL